MKRLGNAGSDSVPLHGTYMARLNRPFSVIIIAAAAAAVAVAAVAVAAPAAGATLGR